MRIPESNISTTVGATPQVTAVSTQDTVSKAMQNLGAVGEQMFGALKEKKDTSEYLDFIGEYNTTMETKKASLRTSMLHMDQDGNYKDPKTGQLTGKNVSNDLHDYSITKSEFVQRSEGLGKAQRAKEYFTNVRAQDDITLQLEAEKKKVQVAKKTTVEAVGNNAELFANSIMRGDVSTGDIKTTIGMINDSAGILGEEEASKMKEQFGDTSMRAISNYIGENGRNPNINRVIASMGGIIPEWKRERYEMAFKKQEEQYNKGVLSGLYNIEEKVAKATSSVDSYNKFRMNLTGTIESQLKARSSDLPDVDPTKLYTNSVKSMAKGAVAEAYSLGESVYSNITDDKGALTQFGGTIQAKVEETAKNLVSKGALTKEEVPSFIDDSMKSAIEQVDGNIRKLRDENSAAFIATWDSEVNAQYKVGAYDKALAKTDQIYDENNVGYEKRSYVTDQLIDNEKRAFTEARQQDGGANGNGEKETAQLSKRVRMFGDRFMSMADSLVGAKVLPDYAPMAGMIGGDTRFLSEIAASNQQMQSNREKLKKGGTADKDLKALTSTIVGKVAELNVPTFSNGNDTYSTAIQSSVESLALSYMAHPNPAFRLDETDAIDKAMNEVQSRVKIIPSKSGGGLVLSREELKDVPLDTVKSIANDPTIAMDYIKEKGFSISDNKILELAGNNVALRPFYSQYEQLQAKRTPENAEFIDEQKKITLDILKRSALNNSLTMHRLPNSKEVAFGLMSDKGFVPIPLTKDGKTYGAELPLSEMPIAAGRRKVDDNKRSASHSLRGF